MTAPESWARGWPIGRSPYMPTSPSSERYAWELPVGASVSPCSAPQVVMAAGNKPKRIEEYAGRISTRHENVSVARMVSPGGWEEPPQQPEFEEISVVLKGTLCVESGGDVLEVHAGQAVIAGAGESVRYSTPGADGAEYVAVCIPAFSPQTVHRAPD